MFLADYVTKEGTSTKIAVKKIITDLVPDPTKPPLDFDRAINAVVFEIEYSYTMAEQDIGPMIYDAFFVVSPKHTFIITYILMEVFDGSVDDVYKLKLPSTVFFDIHAQMLDILYKQIFKHHMYCSDIKPGNFVVKKVGGKYKVRAIDFGTDWCRLDDMRPEYESKEIYYVILLIQLCIMIMKQMTIFNLNSVVIKPFFDDAIYTKYMSGGDRTKKLRDVLSKVSNRYNIHTHYIIPALKFLKLNLDDDKPSDFADGVISFMINYKYHMESTASTKSGPRNERSPRRSVKVGRMAQMTKTPTTRFLSESNSMAWPN